MMIYTNIFKIKRGYLALSMCSFFTIRAALKFFPLRVGPILEDTREIYCGFLQGVHTNNYVMVTPLICPHNLKNHIITIFIALKQNKPQTLELTEMSTLRFTVGIDWMNR